MQISGWLYKAQIKTGLFGGCTWEKKFMWIAGDSVFVAPKEPTDPSNPQITRDTLIIKMAEGKVFITKENPTEMQKLKAPAQIMKYGWRISPATGPSHLFGCESDEERECWTISGESLVKNLKSQRNFMTDPSSKNFHNNPATNNNLARSGNTTSNMNNNNNNNDDSDDDVADDFEDDFAAVADNENEAAAFASKKSQRQLGSPASARILKPEDLDFNSRVQNFYFVYNPQKISDVPKIVAAYKGKEALLIQQLKTKYGVEPNPAEVDAKRKHDEVTAKQKQNEGDAAAQIVKAAQQREEQAKIENDEKKKQQQEKENEEAAEKQKADEKARLEEEENQKQLQQAEATKAAEEAEAAAALKKQQDEEAAERERLEVARVDQERLAKEKADADEIERVALENEEREKLEQIRIQKQDEELRQKQEEEELRQKQQEEELRQKQQEEELRQKQQQELREKEERDRQEREENARLQKEEQDRIEAARKKEEEEKRLHEAKVQKQQKDFERQREQTEDEESSARTKLQNDHERQQFKAISQQFSTSLSVARKRTSERENLAAAESQQIQFSQERSDLQSYENEARDEIQSQVEPDTFLELSAKFKKEKQEASSNAAARLKREIEEIQERHVGQRQTACQDEEKSRQEVTSNESSVFQQHISPSFEKSKQEAEENTTKRIQEELRLHQERIQNILDSETEKRTEIQNNIQTKDWNSLMQNAEENRLVSAKTAFDRQQREFSHERNSIESDETQTRKELQLEETQEFSHHEISASSSQSETQGRLFAKMRASIVEAEESSRSDINNEQKTNYNAEFVVMFVQQLQSAKSETAQRVAREKEALEKLHQEQRESVCDQESSIRNEAIVSIEADEFAKLIQSASRSKAFAIESTISRISQEHQQQREELERSESDSRRAVDDESEVQERSDLIAKEASSKKLALKTFGNRLEKQHSEERNKLEELETETRNFTSRSQETDEFKAIIAESVTSRASAQQKEFSNERGQFENRETVDRTAISEVELENALAELAQSKKVEQARSKRAEQKRENLAEAARREAEAAKSLEELLVLHKTQRETTEESERKNRETNLSTREETERKQLSESEIKSKSDAEEKHKKRIEMEEQKQKQKQKQEEEEKEQQRKMQKQKQEEEEEKSKIVGSAQEENEAEETAPDVSSQAASPSAHQPAEGAPTNASPNLNVRPSMSNFRADSTPQRNTEQVSNTNTNNNNNTNDDDNSSPLKTPAAAPSPSSSNLAAAAVLSPSSPSTSQIRDKSNSLLIGGNSSPASPPPPPPKPKLPTAAWMHKPPSSAQDQQPQQSQGLFARFRNKPWDRRHVRIVMDTTANPKTPEHPGNMNLVYGKDLKDVRQSIPFTQIVSANAVDKATVTSMSGFPEKYVEFGWCFKYEGRVVYFAAEDRVARDEWVNFIQKVLAYFAYLARPPTPSTPASSPKQIQQQQQGAAASATSTMTSTPAQNNNTNNKTQQDSTGKKQEGLAWSDEEGESNEDKSQKNRSGSGVENTNNSNNKNDDTNNNNDEPIGLRPRKAEANNNSNVNATTTTPRMGIFSNVFSSNNAVSSAVLESNIPDERTPSPHPYNSLISNISDPNSNVLKNGCTVFVYSTLASDSQQNQPSSPSVVSKLFSRNNTTNNNNNAITSTNLNASPSYIPTTSAAFSATATTAKFSDLPVWTKQFFWTDGRSIYFTKNLEAAKRAPSGTNPRLMVLPAQAITDVSIIAPATMKQEMSAPAAVEKSGLCITYSTSLLYHAYYRGKNAIGGNVRSAMQGDARLILALEDHVKRAAWITAIDNVIKEIQAERAIVDAKCAQQCKLLCDQEELARNKNILSNEISESDEFFSEQRDECNFILKIEAASRKVHHHSSSLNNNNNSNRNNNYNDPLNLKGRSGPPKSGSLIVPTSRLNAVVAACKQASSQLPFQQPKPDGTSLTDEDGFVLSRTGDLSEVQSVVSPTLLSLATKFHSIISRKSVKQLLEERRRKKVLAKYNSDLNNKKNRNNNNSTIDDAAQISSARTQQQQQQFSVDDIIEREILNKPTFEVLSMTIETNTGGAYFVQKTAPGLVMTRKFNNVAATSGSYFNESFAMINDNMSESSAGGISYYDASSQQGGGGNHLSSPRTTGAGAAQASARSNPGTGNRWIKWNLGGK